MLYKCRQCGAPAAKPPLGSRADPTRDCWPLCPACLDEFRKITKQPEIDDYETALQMDLALYRFENICPETMRTIDLDRLPSFAKKHYDEVLKWEFRDGIGLILHGSTGRGKTRLAWARIRHASFRGSRLSIIKATEFATLVAREYHSPGHYDEEINRLKKAPLLFFDDLAKSPLTPREASALFDLIDHRADHGRPNIITTNFVGQSLTARLGDGDLAEPLIRRLREFHHSISF